MLNVAVGGVEGLDVFLGVEHELCRPLLPRLILQEAQQQATHATPAVGQVHGHAADAGDTALQYHPPGANGLAILQRDGVGGLRIIFVQFHLGGMDCSSTKTRKRTPTAASMSASVSTSLTVMLAMSSLG